MLADLLGVSYGGNLTLSTFCPNLFCKIPLDKLFCTSYAAIMMIEAHNERGKAMASYQFDCKCIYCGNQWTSIRHMQPHTPVPLIRCPQCKREDYYTIASKVE